MACPVGALVHDTPGRIRLRVPDRLGDRAYFDAVQSRLAGCTGVLRVSGSPLTGSLLVLYEGDFDRVAAFAREQSLFDLLAGPRPHPFANIQREMQRVDEALRTASRQRWGVTGLGFYGLVGASLWQLVQGRILPPSITLAFQALSLFRQAVEAEQARARPPEQ